METDGANIVESNDQDDLTEQQRQAVELLAAGTNISAAAREIGVTRETVSRWANRDAGFMAALNLIRRDMHTVHKDRLRKMASRAYDVLEESLSADSPRIRLTAALAVIEAARGIEENIGPTSRAAIERERGLSTLAAMVYLHSIGDMFHDREDRRRKIAETNRKKLASK